MTGWTKYEKAKLYKLASQYVRVSWDEVKKEFARDPKCNNFSKSQLSACWHKSLEHRPPDDYDELERYIDFDREMVKNGENNPDEFMHAPNTIPVFEIDAKDKKSIVKLDLADIHSEAHTVYKNLFEKKIEQIYHNGWYTTIIGDFWDNSHVFGKREQIEYRKDSSFIWLQNILKPLAVRNQLTGICIGNHGERDVKISEWNHVRLLARILGVEYFRTQAFFTYRVGNQSYTFLETHGWGGGRKIGSKLNKLEELADQYEQIDAVVMGHHHKPVYHPSTKKIFDPKTNSYSVKHIELMIVPAWINGADYALKKGYRSGAMKEFRIGLDGKKKYISIDVRSMWDLE